MWTGNTDNLTNYSPKNYMYNDKVFILDEITDENCAYLIGDLTNFVLNEENKGKVLTIIINSPGGQVDVMMTIIGLINIAKLNNITILTFVLGLAGSAASMIAIQGDERFMSHISKHFVHFGCVFDITSKHSEIEKIYLQNKQYSESMVNLYLDACNGKLSKKVLLDLQSDERGYLTAEECLEYGLCDTIIETELFERKALEKKLAKEQEAFEEYKKEKAKLKAKKTKKNKTKTKRK